MLAKLILLAALSTQPPPMQTAPSPDALAFGLEKLRWGMSAREAVQHYPALDGTPPEQGEPWNSLSLANVMVAGCIFTARLNFERGGLNDVELDSVGTARLERCGARIKAALAHQYGGEPGGLSNGPSHGYSEYGAWRGPVTEVTYAALEGGFIAVHFSRTPAP